MAAVLASTPPPSSQRPPPFPPIPTSIPSRSLSRSTRPSPSKSLHTSSPTSPAATPWSFELRMRESLFVLDLMESQSIRPDPSLFCTLLKACSDEPSQTSLHFGRAIHQKVQLYGLQHDPFVANSLISMYAKCGLLGVARKLFDEMPVKNVVSWTTVISMYHHAGFSHDAIELFQLMKDQAGDGVRPNAFTCTVVLNSCAKVGNLEVGFEVHKDAERDGYDSDKFIVAALIDMYAKCGRVDQARSVFNGSTKLTAVACTAMIEGCIANGESKEAIAVFRRILELRHDAQFLKEVGLAGVTRACLLEMALKQGQEIHAHIVKIGHDPGVKALSNLVELYMKSDRMMIAYRLFNGLEVKLSGGLWSKMVAGFARNGLYREALKVYSDMAFADVGSSLFADSSALAACSELRSLEEGKQIHGRVIKEYGGVLGASLLSTLLELYCKCGESEAVTKLINCSRKEASCNI